MQTTSTSIRERVETSHGAVERVNSCVMIEWTPEIQLPAEVGQGTLGEGRLTTDAAGKSRVAFESRLYKGHPVQVGVDASRPGLVELAEIARRMADDAAESRKAASRRAAASGLCPRCGSYCYGDCTASRA